MKYTKIGEDFLIKYILPIFLVTSCALDSIDDNFVAVYEMISSSKIDYADEALNIDKTISVIKINRGDELVGIHNFQNNLNKIIVSGDIELYEKHGKIIKTNGLENDFQITYFSDFANLNGSISGYIRFQSPDSGFLLINTSYKKVGEGILKNLSSDNLIKYSLIEEKFEVPKIKWKGSNYYWIDENNFVWMSKQEVSPFGKKIRNTIIKKT